MFCPPDFDMPPFPLAAELRAKREAIILAALRGGHTYDAALGFAKQHISDDFMERAKEDDRRQEEVWEARQAQKNKPLSFWRFCGFTA